VNFTAAAILMSALLISVFAVAVTPTVMRLGYTSLKKVKAEDYVAAVNALAYACKGGNPADVLPRECAVKTLVLEPGEKRIRVECLHQWFQTRSEAYLKAEIVDSEYKHPYTIYKVRIESDKPVTLEFNTTAYRESGYWIIYGSFQIKDNRGLVVEGGG